MTLPLHQAAQSGHLEWLLELIPAHDLHAVDENGRTALHLAVIAGHHLSVHVLVEAQSNVNVADADGLTPLHHAVRAPRLDSLMTLIEAGADVNAADPHGFTPLHGAAEQNSLSKTRFLMEQGANPDARLTKQYKTYRAGFTPKDVAAACGHTNVVRWIEKLVEIL